MNFTDVNAAAGFWPTQHFSFRTVEALDAALARAGIATAWVSAVESILYPFPEWHDHRLFEALGNFPRLRPVRTVNPLLANWEASCRKDLARTPLAALKLFPGYHGYSLGEPAVAELCQFAGEAGLPLLVALRVNDERNQPTCMQVAPVPATELAALSRAHPQTRFIALCAMGRELPTLAEGGPNLLSDISFLDGADTLARAAAAFPAERLVFGSHAPFLIPHAAKLKVGPLSSLPEATRQAIACGNL